MSKVFVAIAVLVLLVAATAHARIVHRNTHNNGHVSVASRHENNIPKLWSMQKAAEPNHLVKFTINMKQRNLDKLEKKFWEVSTPGNKHYGQFLSQREIDDMIAPSKHTVKKVMEWIRSAGIRAAQPVSDIIKVQATVQQVEKLFQTKMMVFKHKETGKTIVRHLGELLIPNEIVKHVDFVAGLSEFMDNTRLKPVALGKLTASKGLTTPLRPRRDAASDAIITPAVLKQFYNVPVDLVANNTENLQGIAAFSDYFSMGALEEFDKHMGITPNASIVKLIGPDCLESGCDEYESDLDVQYITAMGLGVPTWFWNQKDGYWVLEFAQDAYASTTVPYVFSISYGWSELAQCEIATATCPKLGYTSQQYVARTDTEFQKLGVRGVSVLVSDGDDGAPSLGGVIGTCPVNGSAPAYCPTGGCQYSSTKCGGLVIAKDGNLCIFPMGQGSDYCGAALQDQNAQNALNEYLTANSHCSVTLDEDQGQFYHIYSACDCSDLKKVSYAGYDVYPYIYDPSIGLPLVPDYPTSSPYVTSVGATQFLGKAPNFREVGASILTGAKITTGGGFAVFQPMPDYQSAAVNKYLSSGVALPPSNSFNAKNRGYPDIAFNGHNYLIYYSVNSEDTCPCKSLNVDGTSCSSPAHAGLFSLINDQLFTEGLPALGFLNPLLYQAAQEKPEVFNDITEGNNACNRAYCCQFGFTAASGWDPVSGLGSPDFAEMRDYILSVKRTHARKYGF